MYVATKGGERAIAAAHELLARARRGDPTVPELSLPQIEQQLALAVDRVMSEGSLYDRHLAALAIKQARGDLVEAIFLLRAHRTTLPRFGASRPLDTARMVASRRISATFKDIPGGQILGPTFDYTHRLLDPNLAGAATDAAKDEGLGATHGEGSDGAEPRSADAAGDAPVDPGSPLPRVIALLDREGLIESDRPEPGDRSVGDLTRSALSFPAARDVRLQMLARGDEGFLLAMGYSTQRGYGRNHPFAGEIRMGEVAVEIEPEELGFAVSIADIVVTECEMVNQFGGSAAAPPQFTRGYGLAFGEAERKAMAMALVDRALRCRELGEEPSAPAQDEEFVLSHADSVEASGFVQHLKLPHHVDFQSELVLLRRLRAEATGTAGPTLERPGRREPEPLPAEDEDA